MVHKTYFDYTSKDILNLGLSPATRPCPAPARVPFVLRQFESAMEIRELKEISSLTFSLLDEAGPAVRTPIVPHAMIMLVSPPFTLSHINGREFRQPITTEFPSRHRMP